MENSYNWYYEVFINKMKENDLLPQDVTFDNDIAEARNAYFDSFIKYSIDNGAIPAVKSTEPKKVEAYDAYFDAFVKNSIETGLFKKNDYADVTHHNNDFDAYFTASVEKSLEDAGHSRSVYSHDEIADARNAYFDVFTQNYTKSDSSEIALLDKKPEGQNFYFEAFLRASK